MTIYTFSLGDSTTNGLGLCFEIRAKSEELAVAKANAAIAEFIHGFEAGLLDTDDDYVSVRVYAGPQLTITAADIDDTYDEEEEQTKATPR